MGPRRCALELGYWGSNDVRLKQEFSLRQGFVAAGYTEGQTTRKPDGATLTFFKDGLSVSVFLMPTRSTRPSPFRKATSMQFHVTGRP